MISLTLTNVKKFMSQLLMTETFDRFSFIEGEIVTFNTFKLDGYLQKDFLMHRTDTNLNLLPLLWKNIPAGKMSGNFAFPSSKESGHL